MNDNHGIRGVAYYRVSTQRQGQSGLGLEAQREAISKFICANGGNLLAEFTETRSGRKNDRQVLAEALAFCRQHKATLLLAKLDRLSRSVLFIAGLMESKVDFLAIEHPTRDRFWLHLQAAFAEEECRRIGLRTADALKAAKERGVDIGATGRILARRNKQEAREWAERLRPVIEDLRKSGIDTVKATMLALNEQGIDPPGGPECRWHYRSTWKLLNRLRD